MHPTAAEEKEREVLLACGLKLCSKCKNILSVGAFWKAASTATGLQSRCKECLREYRRTHAMETTTYMAEYRQKHAERLRRYDVQYSLQHRKEKQIYDKQYREENKEHLRLLRQKWWGEHHESQLLKKRAYYLAHKEQIRARQRLYLKSKAGRQAHKRGTLRRRARKASMSASDTLTVGEWHAALSYFENRCAYCGMPSTALEQEHVVPLCRGGGYTSTNIVPACKRCNSSKNLLPLQHWLAKGGGLFVMINTSERIARYFDSLGLGISDSG